MVQVLNTVETALEGEYRGFPEVSIRVDASRLQVIGARTLWPKEENLDSAHTTGAHGGGPAKSFPLHDTFSEIGENLVDRGR